jgi:hypothetical protein
VLHVRVVRGVARIVERRQFILLFAAAIGVAVLLVTTLHAIEAFVWAAAYWPLGALPDVPAAVLFSFGAMTTYGGSNFDLEKHWRLIGALEALNGIILFGLTTAFLFSMLQEVWAAGAQRRHR